jgi:hypothetical protein
MISKHPFPKTFFGLVFFVFSTLSALAEMTVDTAWVRTYNGPANYYDKACDLAVDDSGNIYITGTSPGSGTGDDYATIKYHPNGDTAWVRRYNGPENSYDYVHAIAVDHSGNIYVTGQSAGGSTSSDYTTIKYSYNGDTAWIRRYNGPGNSYDRANDIAADDSSNVYVTGVSGSSYATIKYHPNGDTAWVRRYNGGGADAIAVDDSGNVYVTGYGGTIKYRSNGDQSWRGLWGGVDIALDTSTNVYVTGYGTGSGNNYITTKYHPNGDTAWVRKYMVPVGYARSWALTVDDSGNVYVTGESESTSTYPYYTDYVTTRYYPNGDTAWVRRYALQENSIERAYAIALDSFDNVYVTGRTESPVGLPPYQDCATIKYYPNGDTAWVKRYDGPANQDDDACAVAVDDSGNIYVTGWTNNAPFGIFYDYLTIKYVQFEFLRGDVNHDEIVDVTDVVYLINHLFIGGPPPYPYASGDATCDAVVNAADVVYLINFLFIGGPPPHC